jgi:hypothetical protein
MQDESEPVCGWAGCVEKRHGDWRFCKRHLDIAKQELKDAGYLQPFPWHGWRPQSMRENTRETKYGRD